MGLQDVIGVSFVDLLRDERGWRFSGGRYVDTVNGIAFPRRWPSTPLSSNPGASAATSPS